MVVDQAEAIRVARRFVRSVQESGIHLQGAYLYGSFAKGTAHPGSDIDIALISQDLSGWIDDLERIKDALLAMDSRIEHVRIRPENFVDENPLAWEIKTTGISLLPQPGKNSRAARKPTVKRTRRA